MLDAAPITPATPAADAADPAAGDHPEPTLGATPVPGGVRFGLWAPHAESVWVKGSFNDWRDEEFALQRDGRDQWWATVPGVPVGAEYLFTLATPAGRLDRIDPRALQVTHSAGHAVVADPAAFDWQGDEFQTPDHHTLVIYELHTGSFNPRDAERPGDFASVQARLPYLQRLGVTAIQLMPVAEFPGDRSWGYNPADRKSTRLNSSHSQQSRMPSSA